MSESSGSIVAIHITPEAGGDLQPVKSIRALPGKGLEGDRYFHMAGTFTKPNKQLHPSQEASLIEIEALEGLHCEHGLSVSPAESRRNILTRGIRLNDLVGREFTIGGARMKGIKLCHPCDYLESKSFAGVKAGLENRGGLRAQILNEGVIAVGDAIVPEVTHAAEAAAV